MEDLRDLYKDIIKSHIEWLKNYNKKRVEKWKDLLNSNPEAAICEACVRDSFARYVDEIQPNEDLSYGGPDFLCSLCNQYFYVEVTCISIESATEATGLPHPPPRNSEAAYRNTLTEKILGELVNKTKQCSGRDHPCVLAIGTLHSRAGRHFVSEHDAKEVLTGTTHIRAKVNLKTGEMIAEPHNSTDLHDSSFIRFAKPEPISIEEARKTISAVLLYSLCHNPYQVIGLLHPKPNKPFPRELLSEIKFGKLKDDYDERKLEVEWI
jgi:hypothetical protein